MNTINVKKFHNHNWACISICDAYAWMHPIISECNKGCYYRISVVLLPQMAQTIHLDSLYLNSDNMAGNILVLDF